MLENKYINLNTNKFIVVLLLITGPYVARHQKGGWRVRVQRENWAAVEMMRAQALTLQTIIRAQYRSCGWERGQGRGGDH